MYKNAHYILHAKICMKICMEVHTDFKNKLMYELSLRLKNILLCKLGFPNL